MRWPTLFAWFSGDYYTMALATMMLCTALNLKFEDFERVFKIGKRSILFGLLAHVLIKPPVALCLGHALALPSECVAGLVLLAAAPGAQAASVAVLLARGNVALSVATVTLLNLLAFALTPALTQAFTGAVVAVDAIGISRTTLQVVLAPILAGMVFNKVAPEASSRVAAAGPPLASVIAVLFAGSGLALIAPALPDAPKGIFVAVAAFHVLCSILAQVFARVVRIPAADRRVLTIHGGMQSSSLAFLLATRHLNSGGLGAIAPAISVSMMLLWGMTLARVLGRVEDDVSLQTSALSPTVLAPTEDAEDSSKQVL